MIRELTRGLGVTFKVLMRPKTTIQYPNVKKKRAARFRGRHELRRYDNGLEMCIGCELCQVACPANAITVIPAENDPTRPHSPGERYAYRYEVDLLRCIFCGLCEEACPTDCLHLTQEFELADFSRESLIVGRDTLLAKEPSHYSVPPQVYPPYHGRVSLLGETGVVVYPEVGAERPTAGALSSEAAAGRESAASVETPKEASA